jgi:hypothetical protein
MMGMQTSTGNVEGDSIQTDMRVGIDARLPKRTGAGVVYVSDVEGVCSRGGDQGKGTDCKGDCQGESSFHIYCYRQTGAFNYNAQIASFLRQKKNRHWLGGTHQAREADCVRPQD